ncbi:MAG: hypothetical protein HPY53_00985 [Brevinematales bacterium]|nr:hypothetical protein [Brevinematales bacterium]
MSKIYSLILAISMVVLTSVTGFGKSMYYFENFSSSPTAIANGWDFNFRMSRDMIVFDLFQDSPLDGVSAWDRNHPGTVNVSGNMLNIYGKPNNSALSWNNWYLGDGAKWDPKNCAALGSPTINASLEEPFGYVIIRYTTSIDARGDSGEAGGYANSAAQKGLVTAWIAQDNGAHDPYDTWENYVYFYDKANYGIANNTWGYYKDYEHDVAIAALTGDVDSVTPGNLTGNFRKNFDDNNLNNQNCLATQFADGDGYTNPITTELGIKITHDGETVKMYINPDPIGDTANVSNTWVLVGSASVGWYDDLVGFFGIESPFFREGEVCTAFDNFYIRTVASNLVASITPQKAVTGALVPFTVSLTPQMGSTNDSGIGEIYIKKPTGYGAWIPANVWVTNTAGVVMTPQTGASYRIGGLPANNFYVEDRGGLLYIRFGMLGTDGANNVVTNGTIKIGFSITTPATGDRLGQNFEVFADCTKHARTGTDFAFGGVMKYATTGKKKAYANGTEGLLVRTYTQPKLNYAKVEYSPSPIIVGTEQSVFTVKISSELVTGAPDISHIRIQIPSGFTVSNNSAGLLNIQSMVLKTSSGDLSTNNAFVSGGYIYVYYTNSLIGGFPGEDGFDRISFNAYGTPSIGAQSSSNFLWQVAVNSSFYVTGTTWQNATNTSLMQVTVAKSNAIAVGSISPDKVAIFAIVASNQNSYTYSIKNQGKGDNSIIKAKISVPVNYTGISVTTPSAKGASVSYTNSERMIYINYGTPLKTNDVDTIQFTMTHTNTNVNSPAVLAPFILYADNGNLSGYVMQSQEFGKSWSVTIKPPTPSAANFINPAWIYTTAITNTITNTIYNTSPRGVSIKYAMLMFSADKFPTILSVNTTYMKNPANIIQTNFNGTNFIYLKFFNDTNGGLFSKYVNNDKENVIVKFIDSVNYATFSTNRMPTNVTIPVYVYKSEYETNDVDWYDLAEFDPNYGGTNKLYFKLPPVSAKFSVSPQIIASSSVTNDITFVLSNTGLPGNRIHYFYIPIPADISTNVLLINPSVGTAVPEMSLHRIKITLSPPLDGGQACVVTFKMVDIVGQEDKQAYFYPSVRNDLEYDTLGNPDILSGKSGKIDFEIPKPSGGGGGSPNVVFVQKSEPAGSIITQQFTLIVTNTGIGQDIFEKIMVKMPKPLKGFVKSVYSTRLNLSSTNSAYFTITSTNIQVNYIPAAKEITAGKSDTLIVTAMISNMTLLPTNGKWEFFADNGFYDIGNPGKTYYELTNLVIGSAWVYGTERVKVTLLGDTLTTVRTNTFTYDIKNGTNGSLSVNKVRIKIPSLYTVNPSDISVTLTSADVTVSGGYIWLTYPGSGLLNQNMTTHLSIKAVKPLLANPTNVDWKAEVYYTNNTTAIPCQVKGTSVQQIKAPNASFYAYVNPNTVGKDNISTSFSFIVTNTGELSNNMYVFKIVPPTTNANNKLVITNVTGISTTIAATTWYSNDGCIYINYGNNFIPSMGKDTIQFTAFDNQNNEGFIGNWKVYGINLKNNPPITASKNPANIGKSLEFRVIIPAYNSSYYAYPNTVSTAEVSNTISIYVNNTGTGTNNITSVKVFFASPFTNAGLIATTIKGSAPVVGSNYILVNYPTPIPPSSNDVITLKIRDNIDFGNSSAYFTANVMYNTSAGQYISSSVSVGTNLVSFQMPAPSVAAEMSPNDFYSSQNSGTITFRLINKATGSNKAQKIVLYIPDQFTNQMDDLKLTDVNGMTTNITYSAGKFVLFYSDFAVGLTNTLTLSVTNFSTNLASYLFQSVASNGVLGAYTTTNTDSKYLNVVKAPSAELTAASKTVYSTRLNNTISFTIDNNTSGTEPVKYVRIDIPAIFNNITAPSSSKGVIAQQTASYIIVAYTNSANFLPKGQQDTVTMTIWDTTNMVEMYPLSYTVKANNGSGYGFVREPNNGLKQYMKIPLADITNYQISSWFLINTSLKIETNNFIFILSNRNANENLVYSNVIILPNEIGNHIVSSINTGHSGASATNIGSKLIITYSGANGFFPGETNLITFQFTNSVFTAKNLLMKVYSYNTSSYGSTLMNVNLYFKSPQEPTEAYVYNKKILYSIDHYNEIVYKVKNGMYDIGIQKIRIEFNTTNLMITNIYSDYHHAFLPYTTTPSNVLINFAAVGLLPSRQDISKGETTLHFYVVYTNNTSWTNNMAAQVQYDGNLEWASTKVYTGEWNYTPVLLADFGRIIGYVLPGSANPTVKLLMPGSTNAIMTNKFGELITAAANSANGYYVLDYVPPGAYQINFSGDLYKSSVLSNINVVINQITNGVNYKMKKDSFNPNSTVVQQSLCLDDLNSVLIVPPGIIRNYFAVDMWISNINSQQMAEVGGGYIQTPADRNNLEVFYLDMSDINGYDVTAQEIWGNLTLKLYYNETNIAAQGWSENSLAIYYWREMTGEWMRIGGKVNTLENSVTAQVSYIHQYYAIFGENSIKEIAPGFVNVTVDPKIFTPFSTDKGFKNMKLSVGFAKEVAKYEIKIYTLSGELVRSFTFEGGGYTQAEVFWDGTDDEGYPVKSGVFVYRVIADGNTYSGTIVLAR